MAQGGRHLTPFSIFQNKMQVEKIIMPKLFCDMKRLPEKDMVTKLEFKAIHKKLQTCHDELYA